MYVNYQFTYAVACNDCFGNRVLCEQETGTFYYEMGIITDVLGGHYPSAYSRAAYNVEVQLAREESNSGPFQ